MPLFYSPGLSVARRNDAGAFDHQDDGAFGSARAVHDALGHDEALARAEIDRALLQIDQEMPFEDEEELVQVVVLVPVILALHDAEANDGIVDPAQRLVVPTIGASRD